MSGLLEREDVRALLDCHPRSLVVAAVRRAIEDVRRHPTQHDGPEWGIRIGACLNIVTRRTLRPVFNATGVVLHTNLGRAPLAETAIAAMRDAARGFTNLEFDLEKGQRGSRYVHCVAILRELTGAEDALVVNNCASALILSLSALSRNREVIVSRGELVEIGGSFRVPDIMERSGATLVEVGTTNRTHLDDYQRAINSRTGAIAKIHRSNFAITGFVADTSVAALRPIAEEHGIPIIHDLGSGLMIDLAAYGLAGEPSARTALRAGATLVMMSGDKLLGGPQAGIVLGSKHAITRLRQDPFARAMRVDKVTIAALTATLELYRDPERAVREIPAIAMLIASPETVRNRCERAARALADCGVACRIVESTASVGAGAFPAHEIPSFALAVDGEAEAVARALRDGDPAIVGHIRDGELLLDMRSIPAAQDSEFVAAVAAALS